MIRCLVCGSSRLDAEGVKCARCGGPPAPSGEPRLVHKHTATKLFEHAKELKEIGVVVDHPQLIRKDYIGLITDRELALLGLGVGLISLTLQLADSVSVHALVRRLSKYGIRDDEILRLGLDEPQKVTKILHNKKKAGTTKRPKTKRR